MQSTVGNKLIEPFLKWRGSQGVTYTYSIGPDGSRTFQLFLAFLTCLSVGLACIENGLHPLMLLSIPVIVAALARRDYTRPFLWSQRFTLGLFAVYAAVLAVLAKVVTGSLFNPAIIAYFTFGVLMVRVLCPLPDRNIAQLVFLSVGMILINCILTNHILFGFLMPVYLFILMGTLLLFHLARSRTAQGRGMTPPEADRLSERWYGKLAAYSAVIIVFTVVMFIFIPRPFLVIPGLSGGVGQGGGLGRLQQFITYKDMAGMVARTRIAFKVSVYDGALPEVPYWRGRVLDKYDGTKWSASGKMRGMGVIIHAPPSEIVGYEIIPYRLQSKYLYVCGVPREAIGYMRRSLFISSNGEVVIDSPFLFSDSYMVGSAKRRLPVSRHYEPQNLDKEGVTPRIEQLAKQWTDRFSTATQKAAELESRLKRTYKYELESPPPPAGVNPIEYFLFDHRAGNCEYFAGALCLMLRAIDIPARVVEGFAGTEKTNVENEFLVRFSMAHAWVEAHTEGSSWTRLDATPGTRNLLASRLWRRITDFYDALEYRWIRKVVYFDRIDQAMILDNLRRLVAGDVSLHEVLTSSFWIFMIGLSAAVGVLVVIVLLMRGKKDGKQNDLANIYLKTMRVLVKRGFLDRVHPWHETNTARIIERYPPCRDALMRFMKTYLDARFGDAPFASRRALEKAGQDLLRSLQA